MISLSPPPSTFVGIVGGLFDSPKSPCTWVDLKRRFTHSVLPPHWRSSKSLFLKGSPLQSLICRLNFRKRIWDEKFRPVILSKWIIKLFLANPAFLWNALGVPNSQVSFFDL